MTQDNNAGRPDSEDVLQDMTQEELMMLYAAELVEEKGVEDTDGSEVRRVRDELDDAVNAAIVDELPEEKVNELNTKIVQGEVDSEMIDRTVLEAGIDVEKVAEDALKRYRDNYIMQPATAGEEA